MSLLSRLGRMLQQYPTGAQGLIDCARLEPAMGSYVHGRGEWMPRQNFLISSSSRAALPSNEEEQVLRWPLPLDEISQRPELAQAMIDDDQLEQQQPNVATFARDASVPFGQTVDSRHGGFVKLPKKRRVIARPPPPPLGKAVPSTSLTTDDVAEILVRGHGQDVVIIDVSKRCDFADSMIICTGQSVTHVQSLSYAVMSEMKGSLPVSSPADAISEGAPGDLPQYEVAGSPVSIEGGASSDWSIVDAGSMVVHVLTDEARYDYDLESLWAPTGKLRRVQSQQPTVQTLSTMRIEGGLT